MADIVPQAIPPVQVVPAVPAPLAAVVAAAPAANLTKDNGIVSHVGKFNGENLNDYNYEFLGIMEQLGLSNLIDASRGAIDVLPPEV
jgi:hypothetical protein